MHLFPWLLISAKYVVFLRVGCGVIKEIDDYQSSLKKLKSFKIKIDLNYYLNVLSMTPDCIIMTTQLLN